MGVPEGGVVTFAHRVVVRRRAELQALGQQPCGREGRFGSAAQQGPCTCADTHTHPPTHRDTSHPHRHTQPSVFPVTHSRRAQSKRTQHIASHKPTLTQTDTDTQMRMPPDTQIRMHRFTRAQQTTRTQEHTHVYTQRHGYSHTHTQSSRINDTYTDTDRHIHICSEHRYTRA